MVSFLSSIIAWWWNSPHLSTKVLSTSIVLFVTVLLFLSPRPNPEPNISVAFIGNSITFFNDLPRLMEALSNNHIRQNSCLHGGARFDSILQTGNGMIKKWTTGNASLDTNFNGGFEVYDFGACTVHQLLFGYDENLQEYNKNGYYTDDGKNPCFYNPVYLQYLNQLYYADPYPPQWDFVVLNDQTKYPVKSSKRQSSLQALKEVYAPYLRQIGATPVFVVTHGYWSNHTNMSGVGGDVPTFTSRLYYGYQEYAMLLKSLLPPSQEPFMAPVGLAYLVLWEENYSMWEKLFFVDGFHPSPHGTFLMANVLYATLYGKMPNTINYDTSLLWLNARKIQRKTLKNSSSKISMPVPTKDEALYLRWVAERVTIKKYRPKSFIQDEDILFTVDADDGDYDYDVDDVDDLEI